MTKNKGPRDEVVREAVVEAARAADVSADGDQIHTLSTGATVRLHPVSLSLIEDARLRIADPDVPKWYNETKDREEENPNDPAYLAALRRAEEERGMAALNAMMLFGAELVEGVPGRALDAENWVRKLQLLGTIDGPPEDEYEREYLYLKYVAFGSKDLNLLSNTVISEEAVSSAVATFPGNAERQGD